MFCQPVTRCYIFYILHHMYFYRFVYILYLHSFHFTLDHSTLTYLLSAIMEPSDGSMVPISCRVTAVYCSYCSHCQISILFFFKNFLVIHVFVLAKSNSVRFSKYSFGIYLFVFRILLLDHSSCPTFSVVFHKDAHFCKFVFTMMIIMRCNI